jgi:hypothetical protein
VVAPPSIHQSEFTYEFDSVCAPNKVPLAQAPDWLVSLIQVPQTNDTAKSLPGKKIGAGRGWGAESARQSGLGYKRPQKSKFLKFQTWRIAMPKQPDTSSKPRPRPVEKPQAPPPGIQHQTRQHPQPDHTKGGTTDWGNRK